MWCNNNGKYMIPLAGGPQTKFLWNQPNHKIIAKKNYRSPCAKMQGAKLANLISATNLVFLWNEIKQRDPLGPMTFHNNTEKKKKSSWDRSNVLQKSFKLRLFHVRLFILCLDFNLKFIYRVWSRFYETFKV